MSTYIVTGAFGFSGRYITQRLLDEGHTVRTLTNSVKRTNPFGDRVAVHPLSFDAPDKLAETMRGADVLINTYWVRFDKADFSHSQAINNTRALFDAAKKAGVGRVVHVSITNPSEDSRLPYFKGKAQLERALRESGLSYSILRPAVLFGREDILVNNIAWALRRFPVFGIFGKGDYRIRPIHVADLAALAIAESRLSENRTVDAVGPESFTFRELVEKIGQIIGKKRLLLPTPPSLAYAVAWGTGLVLRDVMLTKEEIAGLMAGLLDTTTPATGPTKLTEWAQQNAHVLGVRYASEMARRRNRQKAYDQL
ncbi:MAG: NAD(P)H-binding protein [Phycisphaeraceae bacterium]|nr:NAD(P)H-binding protein [Phycisphaeraceae bacterium]